MKSLYLCLGLVCVILTVNGCKKPAPAPPSPINNIIRPRTWSGYAYQQLATPLMPIGPNSGGKDAYYQTIPSAAITITAVNSVTLKVSQFSVAVLYRSTDSAAQVIKYDSTVSGATSTLLYYYAGDSVTLSYHNYVMSEYGFDDPYSTGTHYVGK